MHILLLSPYDAMSHKEWRTALKICLPEHTFTELVMPPRFFAWRIRGNSLSLAFEQRETLTQPYDLIIATSMTDLSTLRGFVPSLAAIPTLVYFHENQFVYPVGSHAVPSVEQQMVPLYASLCADRVLFNTDYNRTTFFDGASALFKKLPDYVPAKLLENLHTRTAVLPVPLDDALFAPPQKKADQFTILWNHRWEYDKAPERFFLALHILHQQGIPFRLHIAGQQFKQMPEIFHTAQKNLADHIDTWGFVGDTTEYRSLMQTSHVAVSSALHDFQGIAMLEAAASGAVPVVPDRLAYTELLPSEFRYTSAENSSEQDAKHLAEMLTLRYNQWKQGTLPQPPDVSPLSCTNLARAYQNECTNTVEFFRLRS